MTRLPFARVLSAALLVPFALASAPAEATVAPRVVGGQPAPDVAPAAALRDGEGRLVCSGVVVGPRALLTAAHCLPPRSAPSAAAASHDEEELGPRDVCFGPHVDACAQVVRVTGWTLHPAWDPTTFDGDLAVVSLADDAPTTAVALSSRRAAVGDVVDVVGYGRTDAADLRSVGEKRVRRMRIDDVADGRVVHGESACNGDSGGPLLDSGDSLLLVAVTSSGPRGCKDYGRATEVLPYAPWITERAKETAAPALAGAACSAAPGAARRPRVGAAVLASALVLVLLGALRRAAKRSAQNANGATFAAPLRRCVDVDAT